MRVLTGTNYLRALRPLGLSIGLVASAVDETLVLKALKHRRRRLRLSIASAKSGDTQAPCVCLPADHVRMFHARY